MKLGFLQRRDLQKSTTLKLEMGSVDSHDVAVPTYFSLQNTRVRLDRPTNSQTFKVDPKFRVLGASCTCGREPVVAQQDMMHCSCREPSLALRHLYTDSTRRTKLRSIDYMRMLRYVTLRTCYEYRWEVGYLDGMIHLNVR